MWYIIFFHGDVKKPSLLKHKNSIKRFKCLITPSMWRIQRNEDHILESSLFQCFFDAFYVIYQLSETKDDIQVVSEFPCLLGHPLYNTDKTWEEVVVLGSWKRDCCLLCVVISSELPFKEEYARYTTRCPFKL